MSLPRSRLACLAALLATAATAHAHEVEEPDDVVVVRGRYDNSVGIWDTASEGGVTPEGIAKRPLSRTGEVLEAIPGMAVTQHSGDGKANQYFLRGFNLDHGTDFAVWVEGMPINLGSHAHGQGYLDLNFMIPELVSKMAYRKGPYFAEDGDFGSAGSVRIGYADKLPASLATMTVGSFNYKRALLAGSPEFGGGNLLYALEAQGADGPWDNPSKFGKLNGVLRYSHEHKTGGFSLTAMGYRADWNATDQIPQRALAAGLVSRWGALDPSDGGASSRYSLSGQWRRSDAGGSTNATFYVVRSRLDLYSNFTFFQDDAANGDQFHQRERRTYGGGTLGRSWVGSLGGVSSTTTLGLQARRDRMSPVALYRTLERQQLSVVREDRVTVESLSPYVSNTTSWTEWFRTIAGLRSDHYRFNVGSDNPANSGRTRDSIVSPKLTLAFGPWSNTEFFASAGSGFHSNDARGTTITVDPATGAAAQQVPGLVRTRGHEIGVRTQAVKGLTTSASLWRLREASELLFVGDAGTTEPSRPSQRTGLEWLAQYEPNSRVSMDATIAWTRARFTDGDPAGPFIPGAPNRVASAGITTELPSGWFGSLRWRYFGPRPLVESGAERSQSTSLVNARVGYAFDKKMRLQLDAYNLFNRKQNDIDYFYESQLRGEAAAVGDRHFHPVEPLALRLTLSIAY